MSRREGRYLRRQEKRQKNLIKINSEIGTYNDIFSYKNLYEKGKKCCNGVRWKASTQSFELHLFSKTAHNCKAILENNWVPSSYVHFLLTERGKTRPIDAPLIIDRQIHKVYTQKVLLPLYFPSMIYNNGASLPGKGYEFTKKMLKRDLCKYYRKYRNTGHIILIDFSNFFPSVSHTEIKKRHTRYILNQKLCTIGDSIIDSTNSNQGVPLGVEPSQAEMVAFPSALDNYIKCQLGIKEAGHYMDDYYILIPPFLDANMILEKIIKKADELKLIINRQKTCIRPLNKSFKFCKATYFFNDQGRIITRGSRDSMKRARHKFKSFVVKIQTNKMSYLNLWAGVQGAIQYFETYNDHNRVLKLRRQFYSLFGFSCELFENFLKQYGEFSMNYTVYKRYKGKTLSGEMNLPVGTQCVLKDNIIYCNNQPICAVTSQIAHNYFTTDEDKEGIERGRLINLILNRLQKKDNNYQNRWDKIWADGVCQKYKRKEHADHWLWNHEFYNAPLSDLQHIGALIGVK